MILSPDILRLIFIVSYVLMLACVLTYLYRENQRHDR